MLWLAQRLWFSTEIMGWHRNSGLANVFFANGSTTGWPTICDVRTPLTSNVSIVYTLITPIDATATVNKHSFFRCSCCTLDIFGSSSRRNARSSSSRDAPMIRKALTCDFSRMQTIRRNEASSHTPQNEPERRNEKRVYIG